MINPKILAVNAEAKRAGTGFCQGDFYVGGFDQGGAVLQFCFERIDGLGVAAQIEIAEVLKGGAGNL